jgi:hypothetical protein
VIPTVILVAFIARLFLPQRWPWLVGIVVTSGLLWAVVIAFETDATWAVLLGAFGFGVINAVVGSAIAAPVRYVMSRRSRRSAS